MSELPYAARPDSHDSFDSSKHENWLINSAGLGIFIHGRIHQEGYHGIYVSDILHKRGPLATDDVLKMEEQALDSNGDPLTVPSWMGELRALAVLPELGNATGEGELVAYYENGVVSFDTFKTPRATLIDGTGKLVQKGWEFERLVSHRLNTISAVARYAVSVTPRDHFFRSFYGLHFLRIALGGETFNPEYLNTVSEDLRPLLAADRPEDMEGAATGVWVRGKRLFATVGLHRSDMHSATSLGKGFISINQATTISDDRTPRAVSEGLWVPDHVMQGVHQFVELGVQRETGAYGFLASDRDTDLYFATIEDNLEEDYRDGEWLPIEWSCETGRFQDAANGQRKKLSDGILEGVFSQDSGMVRVSVRTDLQSEWGLWHEFLASEYIEECDEKILHSQPLGQPPEKYREATWFQFRIEGIGYAEIRDLRYDISDAGSKIGRARRVQVETCMEDEFTINTEPSETRWGKLRRKKKKKMEKQFINSLCVPSITAIRGRPGAAGKSAYQSYLATTTDNPPKTEAEWSQSVPGWLEDIDALSVEDEQLVIIVGDAEYRINAIKQP